MLPILASLAPGLGIDPLLLILPCTLAASCAFMMPVGTPPNAIILGTGLITVPRMCKTGLWLNASGDPGHHAARNGIHANPGTVIRSVAKTPTWFHRRQPILRISIRARVTRHISPVAHLTGPGTIGILGTNPSRNPT